MISHDRAARRLAIGLATLAGFIDALGFLSLGGFFVSFMSGNSTRFAVGLGEDPSWWLALLPLGIIVLFVVGVMLGRGVRHWRQRRPATAILVCMSLLLAGAGALHEAGATLVALGLMTIAMGAANNVFYREGEVSIGVTYMTGTLVKFGQRLAARLLGERNSDWLPYLLLWAGLVLGAVLGALGHSIAGLRIVWAGVVLCLVLTAICRRGERAG